jgi:hypothetical protein
MSTLTERAGYGPIEGAELVTPFNATLGTTGLIVALATNGTGAKPVYWKIKIYNASAGATIAWKTVPTGTAAPTMTADFTANAASHIAPGQTEFFAMDGTKDLYIVASAAGTSCSVTSTVVG